MRKKEEHPVGKKATMRKLPQFTSGYTNLSAQDKLDNSSATRPLTGQNNGFLGLNIRNRTKQQQLQRMKMNGKNSNQKK